MPPFPWQKPLAHSRGSVTRGVSVARGIDRAGHVSKRLEVACAIPGTARFGAPVTIVPRIFRKRYVLPFVLFRIARQAGRSDEPAKRLAFIL
jgi:hypothetical protein